MATRTPLPFLCPLAPTGGTAQELRRQHHKVLLRPSCLRHCQHMPCLCRTYRTRRQLGPSHPLCPGSRGFPELHFHCSWAPGKGTKEPFSSPALPGVEGEGRRKDQCLQNTTIGRKISSGFWRLGLFLTLPLFKEGRHCQGSLKPASHWPATAAMCSPFWADAPLLPAVPCEPSGK